MISRLRRRHRAISYALAIGLPMLVIASVAARPRWAVSEPAERPPDHARFTVQAFTYFADESVRLRRGVLASGGETITLEAEDGWNVADGLLYAVDDALEVGTRLPDDAVLLGALAGSSPWEFALPASAVRAHYAVYSLARQEVAGSAPLPEVD